MVRTAARTTARLRSKGSPVEISATKRKRSVAKGDANKKTCDNNSEDEDEDEGENDNGFIAEKTGHAVDPNRAIGRKKNRPTGVNRNAEYEEDPGRMESQQFLSLAKIASEAKGASGKAGKYLKDFKDTVEEKEQDLIRSIDDQEAQSTNYEAEFLEYFRLGYSEVLSFEASRGSALLSLKQGKATQSLFQKSSAMLKTASKLAAQFKTSATSIASHITAMPESSEWETDIGHMQHVLDVGRQVGERNVENILGIHGKEEASAEAMDVSNLLFEHKMGGSTEVTWANVARKQEKAVRKLVKLLPQD